mmetsp:Transcript_120943/g.342130  ORF Transcript_120943/g.342130 Transcript_120943/m.342130 type:complete len:288 (-) Transcript_120943:220-1083(-)
MAPKRPRAAGKAPAAKSVTRPAKGEAAAKGKGAKGEKRGRAQGKAEAKKTALLQVNGPVLEGTISAWYPEDQLGYVRRCLPTQFGASVFQVEHYAFDSGDLACSGPEVKPGFNVWFRFAGRDVCGRWRAAQVSKPGEDARGVDAARTAQEIFDDYALSVPSVEHVALAAPAATEPSELGVSAGTVADGQTPISESPASGTNAADVLLVRAMRKLGGKATVHEVVDAIRSRPKLASKALEVFSGHGADGWERAIPELVKRLCQYTGEKRALPSDPAGKPAKVYELTME